MGGWINNFFFFFVVFYRVFTFFSTGSNVFLFIHWSSLRRSGKIKTQNDNHWSATIFRVIAIILCVDPPWITQHNTKYKFSNQKASPDISKSLENWPKKILFKDSIVIRGVSIENILKRRHWIAKSQLNVGSKKFQKCWKKKHFSISRWIN